MLRFVNEFSIHARHFRGFASGPLECRWQGNMPRLIRLIRLIGPIGHRTRTAPNGGAGIRFPSGPRLRTSELACAASKWLVTACERAVFVQATKAMEIIACIDIEEGLVGGVGGDSQSGPE